MGVCCMSSGYLEHIRTAREDAGTGLMSFVRLLCMQIIVHLSGDNTDKHSIIEFRPRLSECLDISHISYREVTTWQHRSEG